MRRIVPFILIVVGLINLAPVAGIVSADVLTELYGIDLPEGDLLILLRHRALLFGLPGLLLIVSVFYRALRPAAIVAGLVSMLGFIILVLTGDAVGDELHAVFLIDIFASIALLLVAVLLWLIRAVDG